MKNRKDAPQRGKVRMTDVARLAGVTAMTVSRALSTPEKVSPETLDRVREAVRRSGYLPNYAARSLSSMNSQVVLALVPTVLNSVFSGTVTALSTELQRHGYHLIFGETEFDIAAEERLLENLVGWRPAAVVLIGSAHTVGTRAMLEAVDCPVIELWNLPKKPFDVAVGFSNFEGTRVLTHEMHGWGYRNIGFMSILSQDNDRSQDRIQGFRKAMAELKVPLAPGRVIEVPFGLHSGSVGLRQLLEADDSLDAVLCASDTLATGALMEAHRLGIKVPSGLAIAGFGDVELSAELVPSLTSVRIPREAIGRTAAEIILARLKGKYEGPASVDCGFEVVRRESA